MRGESLAVTGPLPSRSARHAKAPSLALRLILRAACLAATVKAIINLDEAVQVPATLGNLT